MVIPKTHLLAWAWAFYMWAGLLILAAVYGEPVLFGFSLTIGVLIWLWAKVLVSAQRAHDV